MPLIAIDAFEFHHRLEKTTGATLVVFTGPACGACKRLRAVLAEGLDMEMSVFEVDAQQDPALAREFDVFHLPAMHLYLDGRYHCEIQAEATPTALRRAVEAARSRPAEEAP